MYQQQMNYDPSNQSWPGANQGGQQQTNLMQGPGVEDLEETDNSHRPPNAFILYSQAMRSEARQQNPSLSNTEVSRILGKMWKEVPNEIKLQYKQKAAKLQEEFKKAHPDYTYRKARRKRALNELLTKSAQGYAAMPGGMPYGTPDQMTMMQMMQSGAPALYASLGMQQNQMQGQMNPAMGQGQNMQVTPMQQQQQMPMGYGGQMPQQMQGMAGMQGMGMPGTMGMDLNQQQMYNGYAGR
ncbi:HMG box family protein [Tritrichomonas foetus]|uniref:HMG box family protein n=1 Tax=Tritrichomonas foetus TaxID=1144522 RepID=A0A1J4JPW5_9EUKA|nr:HMG box family protein [Tritrichomonas foetus]|eukprot:OHS99276.1 HMG box family protein [Tritrichomonas foetus]